MKLQASKKLRRTILAKTRTTACLIYEPGEMVHSKRENSSIWKEPGSMTGQENKHILLVKYSKTYLKVHAL